MKRKGKPRKRLGNTIRHRLSSQRRKRHVELDCEEEDGYESDIRLLALTHR
jgi:hypothetical protein